METSVITTKGQVVIPSKIRHRHRLKKGTQVCFIEQNGDIVLRPVTDEYIEHLKGSWGTRGKALQTLRDEKKKEREL